MPSLIEIFTIYKDNKFFCSGTSRQCAKKIIEDLKITNLKSIAAQIYTYKNTNKLIRDHYTVKSEEVLREVEVNDYRLTTRHNPKPKKTGGFEYDADAFDPREGTYNKANKIRRVA